MIPAMDIALRFPTLVRSRNELLVWTNNRDRELLSRLAVNSICRALIEAIPSIKDVGYETFGSDSRVATRYFVIEHQGEEFRGLALQVNEVLELEFLKLSAA